MLRVTLLNPKGGCGKTTLATNLATYFAGHGQLEAERTALIDHDAQGSSTRWLESRPADLPEIHGVAAYRDVSGITRTWQRRLPSGTTRVVVDTPASVTGPPLDDLVRLTDRILVPVLASAIDIDAFAKFIQKLCANPRVRSGDARIGVVANRIRRGNRVYRSLDRYLAEGAASGRFDYVTGLRDTQNYLHAGQAGVAVHELRRARIGVDLEEWKPLLGWLFGPLGGGASTSPGSGTNGAERGGRPTAAASG